MDMSKLSDADLAAIEANDMSKVSDAGLDILTGKSMAASARKDNLVEGLKGIAPSLLINAAKPFYGLNQAAWKAAGTVFPSVANMGDYPVEMLNKRQAQLNAEAGPNVSKFTTEPAALIGENIMPTAAANKMLNVGGQIPSFTRMLAGNAAIGGATAMANPEKTGLTPEQFAQEKTKNTAIGMAIPTGLSIGGKLATEAISPTISSQAQKLLAQGVDLTPGQKLGGALKRLEDKLTSYPLVGGMIERGRKEGIESFDKAAFKRVLEPIGGKVPDVAGREGMEIVENQVKHTYNELLPKLTFKATPEFNSNMSELRDLAQNLPYDLGKTFNYNIDQIVAKRMSKNGTIDGVDFKKIEEDLSKKAKKYLSPQSSASENDLGEAYKQALVNLRTTLAETNPKFAKELKDVNKSFANLSIVRRAASAANTQDMFTPSQLAAAVKASDISAGKNKTATGKALMQDLTDAGVSVLPSKIADSGTGSRLSIGPTGTVMGLTSAIPYSALNAAMFNRPEVMNKLANALRGTSPYLAGPTVNKALGE
jgi:hypothetical protein